MKTYHLLLRKQRREVDALVRQRRTARHYYANLGSLTIALAFAAVVCLSSCTITMPVSGAGPVKPNMGQREGRASATVVLGMSFGGDCSTQAAIKAGDIGFVRTVDLRTFNVLGIYKRHTCIVWGE